jgi:hypothetical protein
VLKEIIGNLRTEGRDWGEANFAQALSTYTLIYVYTDTGLCASKLIDVNDAAKF